MGVESGGGGGCGGGDCVDVHGGGSGRHQDGPNWTKKRFLVEFGVCCGG